MGLWTILTIAGLWIIPIMQDHCGIMDMQCPCRCSFLPLHQDPLLEVPPHLNNDLMNWKSPFRDPIHHNIAEQSAFCASLDTPEFIFEGSFFLFFFIPLLALIILYISMGLTIYRYTMTSSTTNSDFRQVGESGCKEQLLQQTEEHGGAGNKSLLKLEERGGDDDVGVGVKSRRRFLDFSAQVFSSVSRNGQSQYKWGHCQ